jgi:hypothetical protein
MGKMVLTVAIAVFVMGGLGIVFDWSNPASVFLCGFGMTCALVPIFGLKVWMRSMQKYQQRVKSSRVSSVKAKGRHGATASRTRRNRWTEL